MVRYWRQPGHGVIITDQRPGPDHHRVSPEALSTWLCPAALQSSLPCPADHHAASWAINNNQDVNHYDAWKETVCKKSKVIIYCLKHASQHHWSVQKQLSVSGLTILIMMKYLLGVRRAPLTLRWPCFPTLYNTSPVGLITFKFSTTTRYNLPWIEDNLRETNTNQAEDKITSEFTSSCSLYPQILPTGLCCEGLSWSQYYVLSTLIFPDAGLCNSYLSEDTIPQTCLTTSMDHKYRDDKNISEHHGLYLTFSLVTRIWIWMKRRCLLQMTTLKICWPILQNFSLGSFVFTDVTKTKLLQIP